MHTIRGNNGGWLEDQYARFQYNRTYVLGYEATLRQVGCES